MSSDKRNVRDYEMDLGTPDQNAGYTVGGPNKWGGMHHSMFTGNKGERYSFDTDQNGDFVPEKGHLSGPKPEDGSEPEVRVFDPPAPKKPGVKVTFNPDCLWD